MLRVCKINIFHANTATIQALKEQQFFGIGDGGGGDEGHFRGKRHFRNRGDIGAGRKWGREKRFFGFGGGKSAVVK